MIRKGYTVHIYNRSVGSSEFCYEGTGTVVEILNASPSGAGCMVRFDDPHSTYRREVTYNGQVEEPQVYAAQVRQMEDYARTNPGQPWTL